MVEAQDCRSSFAGNRRFARGFSRRSAMVGPPPISRNLTPIYVRYRNERRGGSRARGGALLLGNDGQRLLGGDPDPLAPDVTIEMTSCRLSGWSPRRNAARISKR